MFEFFNLVHVFLVENKNVTLVSRHVLAHYLKCFGFIKVNTLLNYNPNQAGYLQINSTLH